MLERPRPLVGRGCLVPVRLLGGDLLWLATWGSGPGSAGPSPTPGATLGRPGAGHSVPVLNVMSNKIYTWTGNIALVTSLVEICR